MPWAEHQRPNLPLALIKSLLSDAGIEANILHANIDLAKTIGFDSYSRIAGGHLWTFIGEWLFSRVAFPEAFPEGGTASIDKWTPFVKSNVKLFEKALGSGFREWMASFRDYEANQCIERIVEGTSDYDVVAFSCSVNQLVPTLAVAKRIKAERPDTVIMLGGAQVEGEMGDEVLRAFPFVDAVYHGEAEVGAVSCFQWALGDLETPSEQLSYRDSDGELNFASGIGQLRDMNAAPTPDYSEYFDAIDCVDVNGERSLVLGLLFESSRGCWWGEKNHCTFCGLNGQNMTFRGKDPELVLEQVLDLSDRFKQLAFHAADNIISQEYVNTFLPHLRDLNLGIEFFYETKSNLRRSDIELYRDARVRAIQPGIESFSSHTLNLMNKGVTRIQNVYLLKLCREYGIEPSYNILTGFPGEEESDYLEQIHMIKRLYHLAPPGGYGNFMLQRFSPMHFNANAFGIENVRAHAAYEHLYPAGEVALDKIAFYFQYDLNSEPVERRFVSELKKRINRWKRRWQTPGSWAPDLYFQRARSWMLVVDSRGSKEKKKYVLSGLEMEVILLSGDIMSKRKIRKKTGATEDELKAALFELERIGVVIEEGGSVLCLAIPRKKSMDLNYQLAPQASVAKMEIEPSEAPESIDAIPSSAD